MIIPQQTHSLNVGILTNKSQSFPDTDALITQLPDTEIAIRTADCVPIILYAHDIKAVAAVHAGWKGSLGGILFNTIQTLIEMGSNPDAIFVAFGPSICVKCYEVNNNLAEQFAEAGFSSAVSYPDGVNSKPHIDLQKVNILHCLNCGIPQENIYPSNECTKEARNPDGSFKYHSWRRSPGTQHRIYTSVILHSGKYSSATSATDSSEIFHFPGSEASISIKSITE